MSQEMTESLESRLIQFMETLREKEALARRDTALNRGEGGRVESTD